MSDVKLKDRQIEEIKSICEIFSNNPNELINVLHKTQGTLGYLPKHSLQIIAEQLKMSIAKVFGVVTFYSFFTMKPKGKFPISVCMGTACYVRGSENVLTEFKKQLKLEVGETSDDGKFSLDSLRCVGACGLAPVVLIGKKVYGNVEAKNIKSILSEYNDK